MGSYFQGMSEQDWTEALPRLRTHLDRDGEIMSILKFSYDSLCDDDKKLFLHIACFFNGEYDDLVKDCLAKCVLDVRHGLHVLAEKSLITMPNGRVDMAELLVHLGRKIVREEYVSKPGKRRFLNDEVDIEAVLSDGKIGSNNVIGINLEWDEDITWTSERAFKRLSNLQFLRIYGKGVNPQSMNHIPQKLRVLIWRNFPISCFPSSFNPQFLVKLEMQDSWLEKLWEGTQPLNNLKWMDFSASERLKELPDLSTAVNLQKLNLGGCKSLVEIPSSIGNAINLRELNLRYCISLVEIPSSITTITNLKIIDLADCSSLVELPFNIETVLDPRKIVLQGCSSLVELPLSIGNAIDLVELDLLGCSSLTKLPSSMRNLGRLSKLRLQKCYKLEVNLANINLESLEYLHLSSCSLLKSYHGSFTEIQKLDPWIGRISSLRRLELWGMKKLVSLPPLPYSIAELDASGCESLERLDGSFRNPDIRLNFSNCFKLNQEARDLISLTPTNEYAIFPAEEVPQCFTHRSPGSSLTVNLNQFPVGKSTKFKVCILCAGEYDNGNIMWKEISVCCRIKSGGIALTSCYKEIRPIYKVILETYLGHLYTFEVEVETEEVTSTELAFEFDLSYSEEIHFKRRFFKRLEIKECGILQLPEVPLLNFTDVVGDYEPSDTELVREDEGRDKMLLLTL